MTARADRLTKRAKTAGAPGSLRSSYPASSARVFVDALERLNYSVDSLLSDAGIRGPIWMTRTRAYRVRPGANVSPSAGTASDEERRYAADGHAVRRFPVD
jgi:hypothetical protein